MQEPFSVVVGQPRAVEQLLAATKNPVHAYLFVGPTGCGKRMAARAFAAALLDDERALRGVHPDVVVVEREGASISVVQAREISRLATRSPVEGTRKVLILNDFHLVADAAPALLKTIEEASPSTIFVILAESIPRELVTVASRCVRIDFSALTGSAIESTLVGEGIAPEKAHEAAAAASGNLERARLLSVDDSVVARRNMWASVLGRLDGTGAAAAGLADEVVAALDHACEPLIARHEDESKQLAEDIKEGIGSGGAAKDLESTHKREIRRLRTDELKTGLALLAEECSARMQTAPDAASVVGIREMLDAISWANSSLTFNPNESLLLQGLFVRLRGRATDLAS